MFSMQFLDIGLGLIVVYLMLALSCTALNEIVSRLFRLRAEDLKTGINNMLKDQKLPDLADEFFKHPLIRSLSKEGKSPSYISAQSFSKVLLGNVAPIAANSASTIADVRAAIEALHADSEVKKTLLTLIDQAGNSVKDFHSNVEMWFNEVMDRVSGWYRKKTQIINIIIALFIAFVANADTMEIAKSLSRDPALREALVLQAQETVKSSDLAGIPNKAKGKGKGKGKGKEKKDPIEELKEIGIPLGWKDTSGIFSQLMGMDLTKFLGLLLTALAISLGAPFWFDMLKKVTNIRAAGNVPKPSAKPSTPET